jgi:uncharacterized protein (DUF1778 family)
MREPRSLTRHPTAAPTESTRLNLHTSPEAKALISRAAALMGTTVSGFMPQDAYEAARSIVADNDNLVLSQAALDAFVSACEDPSEPNEALRALMARR